MTPSKKQITEVPQTMTTYKVIYTGNSAKFKNFKRNVDAASERKAVEAVYKQVMNENYFPQDNGSIRDCDGETIAAPGDDTIYFDGGYFQAEEANNQKYF